LSHHGHHAGAAKAAVVELACRLTDLSGRDVGQHYGGTGASAVSNIRRKVREGEVDVSAEIDALTAKVHRAARKRPKV